MKNFTIILMLAILGLSANAQTWDWERNSTGNNYVYHVYANATTTDPSGNVYVTGQFYSHNCVFGNYAVYNHDTLTSLFSDFYLVKYDADGNALWAVSAGGDNSDIGNAVTTDSHGNVIVTGRFRSAYMVFGTDTIWNARHYMFDCFIVKYDSNGNYLWSKRAGGGDDENGLAVRTDNVGNVYVAGTYKSYSINFGNYTYANTDSGYDDIFLVKMAPTGTVLRLTHYGGFGGDAVQSMAIDASNNVFITGGFNSPTLVFGTYVLNLNSNGGTDMFVAKMDTAGTFLWAYNAGAGNLNGGMGICIDNQGSAYVAGYFKGPSVTFGSNFLQNTGVNTTDVFVVKYKYNGAVLWARSAGGISDDSGFGCATDGTNVYVTGFYYSNTFTFGSSTLYNGGPGDIFVLEYDFAGNPVYAKSAQGAMADNGMAIAVDNTANVYLTGQFLSDTLIFDTDTLYGPQYYKMFIAKLSPFTTAIKPTANYSIAPNIYPNPNNGNFTLQLPGKDCEVRIMDVYGRIVYSQNFLRGLDKATIKLAVGTGIYFWEMVSAEANYGKGKVSVMI